MAVRRSSIGTIDDYPEHLNPFSNEDNHKRIRFWNITKKKTRSNSFSFASINQSFKGLRRSFRSKNRQKSEIKEKQTSPIMLRRKTDASSIFDENGFIIPSNERYIYQGSLTPVPRTKYSCEFKNIPTGYATLSNRAHMSTKHQSLITSTPNKTSGNVNKANLQSNVSPIFTNTCMPEIKNSDNTNPFGDDMDDSISNMDSRISQFGTLNKKKRRAPLPPGAISLTTTSISTIHTSLNDVDKKTSDDNSIPNAELQINEGGIVQNSSHECVNKAASSAAFSISDVPSVVTNDDSNIKDTEKIDPENQCDHLDTIEKIQNEIMNLTREDEILVNDIDSREQEKTKSRNTDETTDEKNNTTLIKLGSNVSNEDLSIGQNESVLMSTDELHVNKESETEQNEKQFVNMTEKNNQSETNTSTMFPNNIEHVADDRYFCEESVADTRDEEKKDVCIENTNKVPPENAISYMYSEIKDIEDAIDQLTRLSNENQTQIEFIDEKCEDGIENAENGNKSNKIEIQEIQSTTEFEDTKVDLVNAQVHEESKYGDNQQVLLRNNNDVWVHDAYNNNVNKNGMKIRKHSSKLKRADRELSIAIPKYSLANYSEIDANSPNPIPKPRRSRVFSKSPE